MEPIYFESLYPIETRSAEIEKMLRFVKDGKSCQVVSLTGVGRSNFLGLMAYNHAIREKHLGENQKWFHFVYVNFSQIRNQPLLEAYKLIFFEIIESLEHRLLMDDAKTVKTFLKESLAMHDQLALFQGLKKTIEYLSVKKEFTLVLLFDRIQQYLPMLTPEFFNNMRVLRNLAKYRFSLCVSTHKALEDIIEPELLADFAEFITNNIIYLPITDKTGLSFRIGYIEKIAEKTIPQNIYADILLLTAGHGKLTRLCVEILLEDDSITTSLLETNPTKETLHETLASFFMAQQKVQVMLYEIWDSFTPAEQSHFLKDLFGKEYIDEHTAYLEHIGIVKDGTITIPFFAFFVQKKKITFSETTTKTITYDAEANTLLKGSLDLSAQLTATEFRLLKFFLEHPDQILEREAIIRDVWKESKTTLGVTDQALDQLIFRLRRKIEEDPNNPTHLHTIKGRGFKFQP